MNTLRHRWAGLLGGDDGSAAQQPPAPKGVYMFGGVGCGKTMMMDLLVDSAKEPLFKVSHPPNYSPFLLCALSRLEVKRRAAHLRFEALQGEWG
jgi:predicted ATPase